jgi:uncharacterized membrane protein HdeD (DUF308 family)
MLDTLSRNWWAMALRGLAAILFGLFAFFVPGPTFALLVIVFGAYALVDGVLAVAAAIVAARSHERWLNLLGMGLFGILVGAVTWLYPELTAITLLYLIAAWAVVTGILELIAAFELRRHLPSEWWWVLAGLASVAFGLLLMWHPSVGALAVMWIIGTYAIAFGIFLLGLAWRLREHLHRLRHIAHPI